jgi:hypothetical protein
MKLTTIKNLDIILRYSRLFNFNNINYIIGSSVLNQNKNLKQYFPTFYKLDENFNVVIDSKKYLNILQNEIKDINNSIWIRDININDNIIYFNIELKKNINNDHFEHENYLISTNDLDNFNILKNYNTSDFLFKTINEKIILISKIEKDEEFNDFFWGKYLFEFIIDNNKITPEFDNIVDYKKDKGHVLHNVIKLEDNTFLMLFTIRHLINNDPDFIYKAYCAKTTDFIKFFDTKEVTIDNNINDTKWYSYPCLFEFNNKFYAVSNQDEFGKSKNVLLYTVDL